MMSTRAIASRIPATMKGSAAGKTIFHRICASDAVNERAVSTKRRSICRTPASVFTMMTNTDPMNTSAIFEVAPMPSQMISNGKNATIGAAAKPMMNGSSVSRKSSERPIITPMGTPTAMARNAPQAATLAVAAMLGQIEPLAKT